MNYQTEISIYLYLIFGIFISKSLEALQMTAVMIDNFSGLNSSKLITSMKSEL